MYSGREKLEVSGSPACDVPVNVLELSEVAESPGDVERHRGEAAVRDLVQVLPVALVNQVASAGEGRTHSIQFVSDLKLEENSF